MSVPRVECHLARAQLKRYIAGATLPDEILAELERHLHACPDCLAEAQRMKEALMAGRPLDAPAPQSPLKMVTQLAQAFTAKLPGSVQVAPADEGLINRPGTPLFTESRVNLRILATSGALALTLIAMSTILRDPTRLLGPKAHAPVEASAPKGEVKEETSREKTSTENAPEEKEQESQVTEEEHASEPTTPDTAVHEPSHDSREPEATDRASAPSHSEPENPERRPSQGDHRDRQPTRGLSLPGRPTMEDSPVVTADTHEGVRTRSAPRPSNPPRTNRVPRRAQRTPSSTSSTPRPSNSQDTHRVTVYNPDGTKK